MWRPGQEPTRLTQPEEEFCCACAAATTSGIYLRADPKTLPCQGRHDT